MNNCKLENAKPDWKAFVLDDMPAGERREAEMHAAQCGACQEEWSSLRVTLDAMASLREEDAPRRIAFVSDKVFEPRWWQVFSRPAFSGLALVAAAILAHGFLQAPSQNMAPQPDVAAIEARISQRVQQQMSVRMDAVVTEAVNNAVKQTREQDDRRTTSLLATAERRYVETADYLNKQMTRLYAVNTGLGVR